MVPTNRSRIKSTKPKPIQLMYRWLTLEFASVIKPHHVKMTQIMKFMRKQRNRHTFLFACLCLRSKNAWEKPEATGEEKKNGMFETQNHQMETKMDDIRKVGR